VLRRAAVAAALAAVVAVACAQAASASRFLRVGIYDETQTLFGPPARTFGAFSTLHVQELRLNLYWGGRYGVARRRPAHPANPADPAYNWTLYDTAVRNAAAGGIHVVFSIYGTPPWANHGKSRNVAPSSPVDLRNFAYAAARRYGGSFRDSKGRVLPAEKDWLAWNEPNNPVFLWPQYQRVRNHWVIESAVSYAAICNAVYTGVHATLIPGERVACGVTAPRGNNNPSSSRPSVSPLVFLRALKTAGLRRFDAWAHHPYYTAPANTPDSRLGAGAGVNKAVTLGNINDLTALVTQLYGNKRIWITEYGYQTNPPDSIFGVSWAKQAAYLREAFEIARTSPRIDMFLWFLLRDEPSVSGWQSGLITATGRHKPSFAAFREMAVAVHAP
jgi:hypothetical protein